MQRLSTQAAPANTSVMIIVVIVVIVIVVIVLLLLSFLVFFVIVVTVSRLLFGFWFVQPLAYLLLVATETTCDYCQGCPLGT